MPAWDERLFGWLYKKTRARTQVSSQAVNSSAAVELTSMHHRLELFASMLAGDPIKVREAEGSGGYRGNVLLLPKSICWFPNADDNEIAYLFRTAYSVSSRSLGFTSKSEDAQINFDATVQCIAPTIAHMHTRVPNGLKLIGALLFEDVADPIAPDLWTTALVGQTETTNCATPSLPLIGTLLPPWSSANQLPTNEQQVPSNRPTTTHESPSKDYVRRVSQPEEPETENPLVHSFEKVHTLDTYTGGQKRIDGDDELTNHAAALDELDLRDVVRSHVPAGSMYRANILIERGAEAKDDAPTRGHYTYDEWDVRKSAYRKNHCQLYVERDDPQTPSNMNWINDVKSQRRNDIRALQSEVLRVGARLRPMNRQLDGAEVDVDAVVDAYATTRARLSSPTRLYIRKRQPSVELSSLILLDLSLSSDAYVQGKRVLDIAREAMVVFGEALRVFDTNVAIAGFYGSTHRNCRFRVIKEFSDPWETGWRRLSQVTPAGYTRIGPAIRHAQTLLRATAAKRQVLVVLSDAKPTDYDGYEGRHGIMDVRQAVRECAAARIVTYGLVLAPQRRHHHATMFGEGRFALLPKADHSAVALTRLFRDWLRR